MKTLSLLTAMTLVIAAPALGQSNPMTLAIEQSNQSASSISEIIDPTSVTQGVATATDGDDALSLAMELLGNGDGDDLGIAWVFPSEPSVAADVFDRLASE